MIQIILKQPFSAYRISCLIVAVILVLTVVCSVLPFYVLGINQQPVNLVIGGQFDPKGQAFYQSTFGSLVYVVGIIMLVAAPIALIGYTPVLLWSSHREWKVLSASWKITGLLLVTVSFTLLLFLYTGAGKLILTWLMD